MPEPSEGGRSTEGAERASIQIVDLLVANLAPDPMQPRKEFAPRAIRELADSINQHGILQPLLVRPMRGPGSDGRYWIVGGERRYRAAQLIGLPTLPCRVLNYVNTTAAVVALAENVHRQDLGELEKAEALLRIKTLTDRTWDQVADLVKLSKDYVKRLAGLLKLEDEVQEMVRAGQISARTAIALKPLPPRRQIEMARRVVAEGMTAEEVRAATRPAAPPRARRVNPGPPVPGGIGEDEAGAAHDGTITRTLRESADFAAQLEQWLDGRDWAPSRVSARQQAALEALYQNVTLLQQNLIYLRGRLREAEAARQAADPLPLLKLPD